MTSKQPKAKPPELKVVFDSNVLYTGSASDLLNYDVIQLIKEHSNHPDLAVTWYLPDMVVHERQFQMLKKGQELLPSIHKLEKLLGHNLHITEGVIESRVKETVEKQIQEFNIQRFSLASDQVDWNKIALDAAYRRPPFEYGEKEKGFRDALILETFLQIVTASPTTPKICRIALVTNDKLLGDTAKVQTSGLVNVRVLSTNEELKSLINTLVTEVGEEFVAKIQEQAKQYFFSPGEDTTLYFRENISERIQEKYNSELLALPKGADWRENGTWYISPPRFVKKERQRVSWTSRISVEAKAYKRTSVNIFPSSGLQINTEGLTANKDPYFTGSGISLGQPQIQLVVPPFQSSQQETNLFSSGSVAVPAYIGQGSLIARGKSIFEVNWSVSVSTSQKFSTVKLENIRFIETSWE